MSRFGGADTNALADAVRENTRELQNHRRVMEDNAVAMREVVSKADEIRDEFQQLRLVLENLTQELQELGG